MTMRVALLTKHTLAHGLGGVQVHADGLARGLVARGHELVVLTTSLPGRPEVVRSGSLEVQFLANTRSNVYSGSWWRESVAAFERIHRTRPFDLALSEDLAGSSLIRHRQEIPHLPFLQGLALEHVVSEWRQIEGGIGALRYPAIKLPELLYYALIHERSLLRRAPMVAVVSRRAEKLLRRWYRVPEGAIRLLPNWVDTDLFRPDPAGRSEIRRALSIPPGAFVFLMVSGLTKQKGVQIGLEAVARLWYMRPRPFLLVVGDGPYRSTLEQKLLTLGLSGRARFVGALSNAETAAYYRAADAFLFPTLRMEGVPFVALEAMASALPVIASRRGAVPEAVGDDGFLVRPGDVHALSARMQQLLEDPHLAKKMGEAARERVTRLYAKEMILARVEEVCRELVEKRR